MSEILIRYSSLESAINHSVKMRRQMGSFSNDIKSTVTNPINRLSGTDSYGYAASASALAKRKINSLVSEQERWKKFEEKTQDLIDTAKEADRRAANSIAAITEEYIPQRNWFQKCGDWIYNTFCVDLINDCPLLRAIGDSLKWIGDKLENCYSAVKNWFKYGAGKYVMNIVGAVVSSIVAVGSAIAAIGLAIGALGAFVGGTLTISVALAVVGAIAATVSAGIVILNSVATIYGNHKAKKLYDSGDVGASRFYASIDGVSSYIGKNDMGSASENAAWESVGDFVDDTKTAADTISLITNIASLGNVHDYRIKTKYDIKGFDPSKKNIIKNIRHDLGFKVKGGLKKGFFVNNPLSNSSGAWKFKNVIKNEKLSQIMFKTYSTAKKANGVIHAGRTIDTIFNPQKIESISGAYSNVKILSNSLGTVASPVKDYIFPFIDISIEMAR